LALATAVKEAAAAVAAGFALQGSHLAPFDQQFDFDYQEKLPRSWHQQVTSG
jgi:hypothetical protein